MTRKPLYPLKFKPIPKSKIWGGKKLKTHLKKNFDAHNVGESWELSAVPNNLSVVSHGPLEDYNLQELIEIYKEDLVGQDVYKHYGETFPLLLKFIDAKENLSVQLHPNDALAKERHNSFGKTEMWYVMQADEGAELILGFKESISKNKYIEALADGDLSSLLKRKEVKQGDVFHITPGRIHAIGKGVLLAEIQQTSDITYRVYDWDRKDENGVERELHTDLALEALDFSENQEAQIFYKLVKNNVPLVHNSYFKTNLIVFDNNQDSYVLTIKDSFTVLMSVEGTSVLRIGDFNIGLELGETILIPAKLQGVEITSNNAKILEVSV